MKNWNTAVIGAVLIILLMIAVSCAPGNTRFEEKAAGFWAGLWHGFICVFTFIIGLFSDNVTMYEVNNSGNWYNFGFLLGAAIFLGGGSKTGGKKWKSARCKEKEWEEIGAKVESKVRKGIQSWLDEDKNKDDEWEEIGKKVEDKIKRELRKWAEK